MVWVLAFLLYGPAIISWEYISGESIIPTGECYAEFFYNWYFLMTASMLEFFTPFISVMFFNLSIYLNIQKRTKLRLDVFHEVHNQPFAEEMEMSPETKFASKCCKWEQKEPAETLGLSKSEAQAAASTGAKDLLTASSGRSQCCNKKGCKNSASALSLEKRMKIVSQGMTQRFRLSRDKKVAKSLAIIVGVFGICWAPYTLLMIIRAGCHGHCISDYWYETSFWLLWINSAVNPVLYPLCHYSFRRAFIKLLCPKKLKIQPQDPLQNCWKWSNPWMWESPCNRRSIASPEAGITALQHTRKAAGRPLFTYASSSPTNPSRTEEGGGWVFSILTLPIGSDVSSTCTAELCCHLVSLSSTNVLLK